MQMRTMIALSLLFLLSLVNGQPDGDCNPTPQNFPTLFLNGCIALPQSNADCNTYWSAFAEAFANTDPSAVTTEYVFILTYCIATVPSYLPCMSVLNIKLHRYEG